MDVTPEEQERFLTPKPKTTLAEAQAAVNEWFPYPDKRYEDAKGILDDYQSDRELED